VRHLHPSSLILLAAAVLLALASREGVSLYFACSALALAALILAASGLRLLVRRSRWLLLTMLVMFGWFTPGTPLPGIPGASQEGLLLVALATLALLLKALTPAKLVAGLRSLLAASSLPGPWRDRIAVRLALTLQEVEASRIGQREEPAGLASSISLPAFGFGATDYILGALSGALVLGALLT
jgi:energy-coupling factor transport system permease protein